MSQVNNIISETNIHCSLENVYLHSELCIRCAMCMRVMSVVIAPGGAGAAVESAAVSLHDSRNAKSPMQRMNCTLNDDMLTSCVLINNILKLPLSDVKLGLHQR